MRQKSKKGILCWLLLPMLLWLSGCAGSGSLSAAISRAEDQWRSQGLENYDIKVSHTSGTWHHQTHQITVRDGAVIDFSAACVDAPMETVLEQTCEVKSFAPESFTVPGLFARIRDLMEKFPAEGIEIGFDPTYGYPIRISFDLPDMVDEEQVWFVVDFQVLPD